MSIENPLGNLPPEEKGNENKAADQGKKKSGSKLGNWARKTVALTGILGTLGSAQEVTAEGREVNASADMGNHIEQVQASERGKLISDDKNFEVREVGDKKKTDFGTLNKPRIVEQTLFSVLNKSTGERKYFFADSGADAITVAPRWFLTENDKRIIETERAFQQSGLTDPKDSYKGPIKVGEDGSGIEDQDIKVVDDGALTASEKATLDKVRAAEKGLRDQGYIQE